MNNLSPTAYQREERKSLAAYEERVADSLNCARAVVTLGKSYIRAKAEKILCRVDQLVNAELATVSNSERKFKAILGPEDRDALIASIMQAIDDHYFLPLNLMSEESNEQ